MCGKSLIDLENIKSGGGTPFFYQLAPGCRKRLAMFQKYIFNTSRVDNPLAVLLIYFCDPTSKDLFLKFDQYKVLMKIQ